MQDFKSTTILVTGGTGSFGQKFVEVLAREYQPRKLIVYSRDEWKQNEMARQFNQAFMRYFIGDVRDLVRLRRAMQGVDVVVHAATMKQVPACEYNPIEAVETNINGTRNIIEAALDCKVRRVLALSTDKATAPLNLYGATKLVAEKLFIQGNAYSGAAGTRFSCVRYGNVLGSRGSVIPLFQEQRPTGRLTVTDERMTRFWITLEQGVRFVIACLERMHGGEVFVPKISSMKVVDVARAVAPDCRIETVGIRPGEKLHEVLISEEEARQSVDRGDHYVILPIEPAWPVYPWEREGRRLPEGFAYTSDRNEKWMTAEEMLSHLHG